MDGLSKTRPVADKRKAGMLRKIVNSAGMLMLGFAATAIPLHLLLKRELRDAPEALRALGWPIRLIQVVFLRYVIPRITLEGLENLPQGSYLVAANHSYKSGVDGFILGHLFATRAGRVPRIVVTADRRNFAVAAERWVLHHYGIALLVPDETHSRTRHNHGVTDVIAGYLKQSSRNTVIIFPAGRAATDPAEQLSHWSTGVVVSAEKSGCPIVPVAIGGLPYDWTPETVLLNGLHFKGAEAPFRIHVRIGKPITPKGDAHVALEELRAAVGDLMKGIPGLGPA
jgi:1-acyl-sn-glycerol-3-phosphate acyltransferase